ncbi:MAG: hypothetical protein KBB88_02255 [Candidatus Pacebacteria bacterium]|nr:hypothetical protein [Candidatus Paceibacterota bacterium]
MEEFSLKEILQSLQTGFSRGIKKKEKIAEIISTVVGFTVADTSIRIHGKKIYIQVEPIIKSEIFYKKKECLEKLQNENFFFEDVC